MLPTNLTAFILSLVVVPLAALALPGKPRPSDFALERKWELLLSGNLLNSSFALCSDGTVYVMHDHELQVVSSDGHLIARNPATGLMIWGTTTVCTRQKRLVIADREISIFELDAQGNLSRVSSARLKLPVNRLLATPDGLLYGITADEHPSLIEISPSGNETLLGANQPPHSAVALSPEDRGCTLTWDEDRKLVAYQLPGQSGIQFLEGTENIPKRNPIPSGTASDAYACGQLLSSANLIGLPNGLFARVQIYKSEIADALSKPYIEILDDSLRLAAQPIPADKLSFLIGAAADGSLYFASFHAESSLGLIKCVLVPEHSPN
jgi:hypothetical protein